MGKNLSGDLEKKKTQAEKVRELREKVEEKLVGPDMKASLADYIRLVQLQQELEEDDPTTAWLKEVRSAQGKGFESVVLFALDQFCLVGLTVPLPASFRRSER